MATNHRISSDGHDRYQGAVKAKELRSQKHEHGNMQAGLKEEVAKPKLKLYDSFDKGFKLVNDNSRSHQSRDKVDGNGHRHGEIDRYDRNQNFDRRHFAGRNAHHRDTAFSYGKPHHGSIEIHKGFSDPLQHVQVTQVTYSPSAAFSGVHLGSSDKVADAHKNFISAALGFLENPNKETYKALTESMTKLLDPRFTPAVSGGAVNVQVQNVNGTLMAKFTMEVTPAATKSLDEAREDLKNAFSSKRNGEKGIDKIREEAHANYIRALSEKFKDEGKISHTNHTPTTPVFKASTIYIVKVTQFGLSNLHELKKPDFKHNLNGKLSVKGHHDFWNGYRQNHKSYVDMRKHDSKKSHGGNEFHFGKKIEAKHYDRHSVENRSEKPNHNHHQKVRTHK